MSLEGWPLLELGLEEDESNTLCLAVSADVCRDDANVDLKNTAYYQDTKCHGLNH